jgi:general secretion pathway protein G
MEMMKKTIITMAIIAAPILLFSSCSPCSVSHARVKASDASIAALRTAVEFYAKDCGVFPSQGQGLAVLLVDPGQTGWKGPYIRGGELPSDPWGTPFRYQLDGEKFSIVSAGPDLKFDTADDGNGKPKESRTTGCSRTR